MRNTTRKLNTKWREEPICPKCHEIITVSDGELTNLESCPNCGQPISCRIREKVEYLILS
ncbi:MAG: hypothetical protein JRJ78_14175 [Deltaproteobacteria bacterium]|nr:hypothetical protein [Deltaproteobacteria bacterium]